MTPAQRRPSGNACASSSTITYLTGSAGCFEAAGHEVIYQRQAIATDATDIVVALASAENDAILISFDKDFRVIASRFAVSNRRLRKLSRIHLRCRESDAAKRVLQAMSLIEAEWTIAQQNPSGRLFVEIQADAIKTLR